MSFDQLLKQRIREHAESTDQGAIEGARKQNAIRKEKNSKRQRKFYLAHQDELREKSKKRSQRYRDAYRLTKYQLDKALKELRELKGDNDETLD